MTNHPPVDGASNRLPPRAKKACRTCNARRVRCNVMEEQPCKNCKVGDIPCELMKSKRGKYANPPHYNVIITASDIWTYNLPADTPGMLDCAGQQEHNQSKMSSPNRTMAKTRGVIYFRGCLIIALANYNALLLTKFRRRRMEGARRMSAPSPIYMRRTSTLCRPRTETQPIS